MCNSNISFTCKVSELNRKYWYFPIYDQIVWKYEEKEKYLGKMVAARGGSLLSIPVTSTFWPPNCILFLHKYAIVHLGHSCASFTFTCLIFHKEYFAPFSSPLALLAYLAIYIFLWPTLTEFPGGLPSPSIMNEFWKFLFLQYISPSEQSLKLQLCYVLAPGCNILVLHLFICLKVLVGKFL